MNDEVMMMTQQQILGIPVVQSENKKLRELIGDFGISDKTNSACLFYNLGTILLLGCRLKGEACFPSYTELLKGSKIVFVNNARSQKSVVRAYSVCFLVIVLERCQRITA